MRFLGRIQIWLHFSIDSFVTHTSLLQLGVAGSPCSCRLIQERLGWNIGFRGRLAPPKEDTTENERFVNLSGRGKQISIGDFVVFPVLRSSEATLLTKHCGKSDPNFFQPIPSSHFAKRTSPELALA